MIAIKRLGALISALMDSFVIIMCNIMALLLVAASLTTLGMAFWSIIRIGDVCIAMDWLCLFVPVSVGWIFSRSWRRHELPSLRQDVKEGFRFAFTGR